MAMTLAALAALIAASAARVQAQARIELKLAHTFPASHGMHTDFLQPWARELEQRTRQRVRVSLHDGPTPQGNPAALMERLETGELDIVHGLQGVYPKRFARSNLMELPFVADNAAAASRVLWALKDRRLKPDYAGLKVLALHADNGGLIHTGAKKVVVPADLKGLRLRSPSAAANRMLTGFGATPLGMPPAQTFANLRAGLIDGALFSWDSARQYRIIEAARHHLDARVFSTPYFFVMTQKRFQSLPAEVRAAIDEISGTPLVEKFGPWWDKWDQTAKEAARKRGNIITVLSAAQRAEWAAKAVPATQRYLAELSRAGVSNAKALHAEMQKGAASARGQSARQDRGKDQNNTP